MKSLTAFLSLFVMATLSVPHAEALASDEPGPDLHDTIATLDARLFDAFNACEPETMNPLLNPGIEFYHDKGGLTVGRDELMMSTYERCARTESSLRRELVTETLEVFPMQGIGAVQSGTHRFYLSEGGNEEVLIEIARFMHVWELKDGKWSIIRAISYDHQPPE